VRARGQGRATHLIYSSPFVSPSRDQEGSHLAIGATKAPLAVFERMRAQVEEGSHLAIGASKAPLAVFELALPDGITSGQFEIVSSWTGRPSGPSPRDIGLIAGMNLWLTILQDSAGRISLGRLDGPGCSARGDEPVRLRGSTVRHGNAGRRVTVAVPVDQGLIDKGDRTIRALHEIC
jgi:hypothetical protein